MFPIGIVIAAVKQEIKPMFSRKNKNNTLKMIALVVATSFLASCNRGTGCPSSFTIDIQPIFSLLGF